MIGLLKLIAGPIIDGFITRGKQKREFENAKHERRIEVVKQGKVNEATWNEKQIDKAGWSRDWLVMLLSIPMVMAFFPGLVQYVHDGFAALAEMPEWYKAAVGLMIGASFGYQKYVQHTMNKAYSLPEKS